MTTPCYLCHTVHPKETMRQVQYWLGIYVWLCQGCAQTHTTTREKETN